MILIERPCCDELLEVDGALPATLRCDACSVEWAIEDPDDAERRPQPAALAA